MWLVATAGDRRLEPVAAAAAGAWRNVGWQPAVDAHGSGLRLVAGNWRPVAGSLHLVGPAAIADGWRRPAPWQRTVLAPSALAGTIGSR